MTHRATCISRLPFTASLLLLLPILGLCVTYAAAAATETTLHSFEPYLHGVGSNNMVADAAGNLYAASGGGSYNSGMIYKLSPMSKGGWTQTVLYNFTGGSDGSSPQGILLDSSGKLYGITYSGGTLGSGVFFELVPTASGPWKEHVLFELRIAVSVDALRGWGVD
jgi:hypothetical protein